MKFSPWVNNFFICLYYIMSSCFRTSNNFYASAPPRMADGRHFTDYRPNCHLNNRIQTENQVSNSYEYRMFLTRNASDLWN